MSIDEIKNPKPIMPPRAVTPEPMAPTVIPEPIMPPEPIMESGLECLAAQNRAQVVTLDKKTIALRKKLQERLEELNVSMAAHRPEFGELDNERFGQDGIKTILSLADSKENIGIINAMLDELEEGGNIWTADIVSKIDPSLLFPQKCKYTILPQTQAAEDND